MILALPSSFIPSDKEAENLLKKINKKNIII